jgi:hypothetical protein
MSSLWRVLLILRGRCHRHIRLANLKYEFTTIVAISTSFPAAHLNPIVTYR